MFPGIKRQLELDFWLRENPSRIVESAPGLSSEERFAMHCHRIASFLSIFVRDSVDVVLTNNRSTMISYKRKLGRLSVRIHRMFATADDRTLKALAAYISGIPVEGAGRILDEYIAAHREDIRPRVRSSRSRPVDPKGKHYDLEKILDRIDQKYFGGFAKVRIGWGQSRRKSAGRGRKRTTSRALATYNFADQTIRVSPVMDSSRVPNYVIEWVVYHEMLHHVLPVEQIGDRKKYHTKKFRALERAFEQYEEARTWEKANLEWLLR